MGKKMRLAVFVVATFFVCDASAKPLLCPTKNEELSMLSTKNYEWKPVYEGYLKEVAMTSMALSKGGRMSMIWCTREKGSMAVKAGTCKMIFGEGSFGRKDLLVGVNEGCQLDIEKEKTRAYPGSDTNNTQCRIECDD
jgi:hypothetical protein